MTEYRCMKDGGMEYVKVDYSAPSTRRYLKLPFCAATWQSASRAHSALT